MDLAMLVLVIAAGVGSFALLGTGWFRMARCAHAIGERTRLLRERFGCEYDRAVAVEGSVAGERALLTRLARFDALEHPAVPLGMRRSFAERWRASQEHTRGDPDRAVREAELLTVAVMRARRFHVGEHALADELSVTAPTLATSYRHAHRIFCLTDRGAAPAEPIVTAAVDAYQGLLEHLLGMRSGELARPRRKMDQCSRAAVAAQVAA